MYENHWQLSRRPFENWGSDGSYYPSEVHQTAMFKLRYALESRHAAMTLCGDSGMGKSLLTHLLLDQLPDELTPTTRILFPQLPADQLIGYLADKITGTPGDPAEPARLTLARLESFLDQNVQAGQHAVVVVDEAHLFSGEQLETLRLLLNLGRGGPHAESAWTLILVGHPTLLNLVERHRSLDERLAVKCLLHRFTPDQTAAYVHHRIKAAGGQAEKIFSSEAIDTLHVRGAGIPRRINRIADLALMVGFAEELQQIGPEHIDGVHQELAGSLASGG